MPRSQKVEVIIAGLDDRKTIELEPGEELEEVIEKTSVIRVSVPEEPEPPAVSDTTIEQVDDANSDREVVQNCVTCPNCGNQYLQSFTRCDQCGTTNQTR